MKTLELYSWADFRDLCFARKNLNNQYTETSESYDLYGPDANDLTWHVRILKDGEADEFESTYKVQCNWAIGNRPYAFATGDFIFAPNSSIETCPAGGEKSVLYQVTQKMYINGGRLVTDGNSVFGDWVEFQIVDHDNLLGYGVDTVLANWIPKWIVAWKTAAETIQTPYAGSPPVGMYFRMTYHSVGVADVGFSVNYMIHKPI